MKPGDRVWINRHGDVVCCSYGEIPVEKAALRLYEICASLPLR
jgi:hypothetical protein